MTFTFFFFNVTNCSFKYPRCRLIPMFFVGTWEIVLLHVSTSIEGSLPQCYVQCYALSIRLKDNSWKLQQTFLLQCNPIFDKWIIFLNPEISLRIQKNPNNIKKKNPKKETLVCTDTHMVSIGVCKPTYIYIYIYIYVCVCVLNTTSS